MKIERVLPMNLQFFAEEGTGSDDTATSDLDDLNSMLQGMGDEGDSTVPPNTEDTPPEQEEAPPKPDDKANHAFAQMRTQNTQLFGLLSKVAKAAGIDFKDNNELLGKLNDDALNKLAKAQNVPVELLQRMEELEQVSRIHTAQKLQEKALVGFQSIKNAYGLTDVELQTFAAELDAKGKNPFLTEQDLETEYRLAHFQDIVKKETQKAVEEALKKSNAADRHSSTPSHKQGKPDSGGDEKISTVAGLNSLLKDM